MSEKIYRFGVIGVGRWGKNIIKTINAMPNVEIGAICTSNPENAKLCKNKVQIYSDYNELIFGCAGLDGHIICVPPEYQYKVIDSCVAALKPFIAEKPFAMSMRQALAHVEEIKKRKLPCIVDYTQLFNPAYRELLNQNARCKTKHILSKVHSFGPFRKDVPMLWDWLPHDLAMIVAMSPDAPLSVFGKFQPDPNYDNAGQINIQLDYKNYRADIEIDNVAGKKYRVFEVENNYGKLCMMDNELYEIRQNIRKIHTSGVSPLTGLIEAFIYYIESGESFGLEMSLEITNIIEKIQESLDSGEIIAI